MEKDKLQEMLGECVSCGEEVTVEDAKVSDGLYWSGCCDAMIEGEGDMVATETKPQHTPPPYQDDNDDLRGPNGEIIAAFADENGNLFPLATPQNRAFIVRAVNSHGDLIKACRYLLNDLEYREVETAGMAVARRIVAEAEGK